MKTRKSNEYSIKAVIDFLNCDFSAPTSVWQHVFFPNERKNKFLREEATRFQDRLRNKIENALTAPRKTALEKLAHELEKAEVAPLLDFQVVRPRRQKNAMLDFGDEKFTVKEKWKLRTTEHVLYCYLYVSLRSGEFSMIKKCRQCLKFFTSYRHSAQACGPRCNRKFHNKKRQEEGYFRDKYKENTERKLKIARELVEQKKDRDFIIERSDLTEISLVRAGVLKSIR